MTDVLKWHRAYRSAEAGDSEELNGLVLIFGVPDIAKERHVRYLRNIQAKAFPPKRSASARTRNLAMAALHACKREPEIGYRPAILEALAEFKINSERVLNNALSRNRLDVNQFLKQRGLMHLLRARTRLNLASGEPNLAD